MTGVPLTRAMASAVGLTEDSLTAMLERRAPLGMSPQSWSAVLEETHDAVDERTGDAPALGDRALTIAVGGSAIACFSSAKTTLEKKRFPQDVAELEAMVRRSPLNAALDDAHLQQIVSDAVDVYTQLALGDRVPRAAWFDILHVLGIEEAADLDIQVHSALIDEALIAAAERDPGILERRTRDRLGRWDPLDVVTHVPQAMRFLERLTGHERIGVEFLGPGGDHVIAERPDWWLLEKRDGR